VPNSADLKQACVFGTILASFTIQDFSVGALSRVGKEDFQTRLKQYQKVITL
jgi:hypothetical protein